MSAALGITSIEGNATSRNGPTFVDRIARHDWAQIGRSRYVRDYIMPLRPVIITGAIDHWPARQKWTLDFFREQYGYLPLMIDQRDLTMAALIDEVNASTAEKPAPYLHNYLVSKLPAQLQADIFPMPDCTRPNWLEHRLMTVRGALTYIELFIGGSGAKFPVLHYDLLYTHAFLMQVQGVKEYVAFAPDQTPLMYRGSQVLDDGRSFPISNENISMVDNIETPDLARFPRFAEASGLRFTLHPGETLFVPSGWWHTARILSPSITVSINGANAANWSNFSRDFRRNYMAGRRAKAVAAAAYLSLVGAYLGMRDA